MPSRKLNLTPVEIATAFDGDQGERWPVSFGPARLGELLGLSVKTIYDWMAKGHLDGTYRKRGKHCLFWRNRVLDVLFNGKDWPSDRESRPGKKTRRTKATIPSDPAGSDGSDLPSNN